MRGSIHPSFVAGLTVCFDPLRPCSSHLRCLSHRVVACCAALFLAVTLRLYDTKKAPEHITGKHKMLAPPGGYPDDGDANDEARRRPAAAKIPS